MDETIAILREQTILCNRLLKLFAELTDLLKNNSLDMVQTVRKIEPVITELSRNSMRTQNFLDRMHAKTFSDFLNSQEKSGKRDVAESLLKQADNLQTQIRRSTATLKRLTKNGMDFVNFNINVMSQSSTNATYGAEATTGTQSNRRIFDTNV